MSTTSSALSGSERTGSLNTILIVLLVLAIAFAAADFIYLTIKSNQDRQASALTTEIQVASQALTTAIQTRSIFAAKSLHRNIAADSTACCVGDNWSPAAPPCGTARSSTGQTGLPVSRSSTNTKPCLVGWITTSRGPSPVSMRESVGCAGKS